MGSLKNGNARKMTMSTQRIRVSSAGCCRYYAFSGDLAIPAER